MDVSKIPPGRNPPDEINAVIEIPQGGVPVKYELDKVSGALFVNRFLHTAMYYPANYGFIPNTLSEDRDPCDCLVLSQVPVAPGAVIRCRPIGALLMEDENCIDEKIIAVPVDALNPFYDGIGELTDLPTILVNNLTNAFLLVYTGLSDCKPGRRSRRSSQVLLDTAPTTSATHSPYSSSRSLKSPPRWAIRRRARSVARSDDGR